MNQIIIAFSGEKNRLRMAELFENSDYQVVCNSPLSFEVLQACRRLDKGVVFCGTKLLDVTAFELYEQIPKRISVLLLGTSEELADCPDGITKLTAPASKAQILDTMKSLFERSPVLPRRSEADHKIIAEAKEILMAKKGIQEVEAHRFLQKRSMDAGSKMVDTARKIISGEFDIS